MVHTLLEKYFELIWKILNIVSKLIGVESTIIASSYLGKLSSYLFDRERQISLAQLNLPKVKISLRDTPHNIIKKNFSHVGESVGELLCIDHIFKNIDNKKISQTVPCITYHEFERLHSLIKNGGVALSGHIGCIELLAAYHVQRGIPLHVIARAPNYKSANTVLDNLRKRYGVVVAWREDPASLRILSKALKKGALLAALIDQDTYLESLFSNFFGHDAAYPSAPIKIALKYKLPIVSAFIYRVRRLKHHIATEQIHYNPEDPNVEQFILDEFNRRLEKIILRYPEQWIWWHRRWRRRPNSEELPSTKNYIQWLNQVSNL